MPSALSDLTTWVLLALGIVSATAMSVVLWPVAWQRALHPYRGTTTAERLRGKVVGTIDVRALQRRAAKAWLARPATRIALIIMCALFVALFQVLGPFALGVAAPGAVLFTLFFESRAQRKHAALLDEQSVEFLALLTQELGAGQPMLQAVRSAQRTVSEPMQSEVQAFLNRAYAGLLRDAVAESCAVSQSAYWRKIMQMILLTEIQSAAPATQAQRFRKLGEMLANMLRNDKKVRGRLSGIRRQQQLVLLLVPCVFGLFTMINFQQMSFFWTALLGKVALTLIVIDMLAVYWGVGKLLAREEEEAVIG